MWTISLGRAIFVARNLASHLIIGEYLYYAHEQPSINGNRNDRSSWEATTQLARKTNVSSPYHTSWRHHRVTIIFPEQYLNKDLKNIRGYTVKKSVNGMLLCNTKSTKAILSTWIKITVMTLKTFSYNKFRGNGKALVISNGSGFRQTVRANSLKSAQQ